MLLGLIPCTCSPFSTRSSGIWWCASFIPMLFLLTSKFTSIFHLNLPCAVQSQSDTILCSYDRNKNLQSVIQLESSRLCQPRLKKRTTQEGNLDDQEESDSNKIWYSTKRLEKEGTSDSKKLKDEEMSFLGEDDQQAWWFKLVSLENCLVSVTMLFCSSDDC